MLRASNAPPLGTLPPEEMRRSYAEVRRKLQLQPEPIAGTEELTIPGQGGAIPARLYRGVVQTDAPCLLYLHGGGWVLGNLDSHDGICRRIASRTGACVLAVDYRLAPEHPFPAAVEDSAAALEYLAHHAEALGIDPARLAVGGDSAGGNLAAVIALMGRDGSVPRTMFQLLFYPATDLRMISSGYERVTEGVLTGDAMRYFVGHYLPDPADRCDWRASPLLAASLDGVPSALVLTVGHDPLLDEGLAYAERLRQAGITVTALDMTDQGHGILNLGRAVGASAWIIDFAAAALADAWRVHQT
ncbi:MAG: alpha/beta hydrolase [Janthinobacterium lividum]